MRSIQPRRILGLFTLLFITPFAIADPTSHYALYRSEDLAQSWSRSGLGLPRDSRINALTATARTFIAGTDAGIFISTNTAKSWQPVAETKTARVTSLTTLDQHTFAGTSNGILLTSTNHGFTWQRNQSFPKSVIRSLHAFDGSIYVGTDANHVYRSSDRGRTWNHLTAGLPDLSQISSLTSLNGRLFAGLYAKGLYTWDNPQKKWLQLGASEKIAPLTLAANDRTLIAGHNPGGIHWSDDLGQTWHHWTIASHSEILNSPFLIQNSPSDSAPFPLLGSLVIQTQRGSLPVLDAPIWEMSANSKIALAGAGSGIYSSTDRARTWTRATSGLPTQSSGIAFLIHENLILAAIHQQSPDCSEPTHHRN
jgi:hypothetical protein